MDGRVILRVSGCEDADWIQLAWDWVQWWAFFHMVMNLRFHNSTELLDQLSNYQLFKQDSVQCSQYNNYEQRSNFFFHPEKFCQIKNSEALEWVSISPVCCHICTSHPQNHFPMIDLHIIILSQSLTFKRFHHQNSVFIYCLSNSATYPAHYSPLDLTTLTGYKTDCWNQRTP